jgi:hypothetical protein
VDKRRLLNTGQEQEGGGFDWLIGDKRANMGLRCRFSRVAALLCFLVVALLLVTLAFGSFVKRKPGPPTVKVSGATAITLQHHV